MCLMMKEAVTMVMGTELFRSNNQAVFWLVTARTRSFLWHFRGAHKLQLEHSGSKKEKEVDKPSMSAYQVDGRWIAHG